MSRARDPRVLLEAGPEGWASLEPEALSQLLYRLAVESGPPEPEPEKEAQEIVQALRGATPTPLEIALFRQFTEQAPDFLRVKTLLAFADLAGTTGHPRSPILRFFLLDPSFSVRATAGSVLGVVLHGPERRAEGARRVANLGMAVDDPWLRASTLGALSVVGDAALIAEWRGARDALPEAPRQALREWHDDLRALRDED